MASAKEERGAGQGRARGQGYRRGRKSRLGKARPGEELGAGMLPLLSRAGSPHWRAPAGLGVLHPFWVPLVQAPGPSGPGWAPTGSLRHQWVQWGHILPSSIPLPPGSPLRRSCRRLPALAPDDCHGLHPPEEEPGAILSSGAGHLPWSSGTCLVGRHHPISHLPLSPGWSKGHCFLAQYTRQMLSPPGVPGGMRSQPLPMGSPDVRPLGPCPLWEL